MTHDYDSLREFAERNGLTFNNPVLLRTALTHRSYLNEHPDYDWEDNERLEYLGDAVLDFLLGEYLFLHFPNAPEGELTALRAALVRRETLARLAQGLALGPMLFMGHGEVETGGRTRLATLCAAFEALVGALHLDQGLAQVAQWVLPLMEGELAGARVEVADKDPKSRFQELAQGSFGITPRYRTVRSEGPDHARNFVVEVALDEVICGRGAGSSKQVAAQNAAIDALARVAEWTVLVAEESSAIERGAVDPTLAAAEQVTQ